MTAMKLALQESGLELPSLRKRCWLWLKDHPGKTAKDVATALNVKLLTVYQALFNLEKRGMVESKTEHRADYRRGAKTYTVLGGPDYESPPLPKKPRPAPVAEFHSPEFKSQLEKFEKQLAAPRPKVDIELLTLAEARDLYNRLREFFE
jgi:DNA-binding transcriptional MocR family regulator